MDKRNVMYIFNDRAFGGAGQSLLDILTEIKKYINPIIIIRSDANVEDKLISMKIRYYKIHFTTDYGKIGSIDTNERKYDIWQNYEAAKQLIPIIRKENIQLIHINSSVSYFAAISALMEKVPYIWHIRELMYEQYGCEFFNEELKKSLYKKAEKLISISNYVQKKYREKYGIETIRLYNGLNINRFKKKIEEKIEFEKNFIVAAMITPEKGQWDVIQATEKLIKKGYNDIKTIIVGSGEISYIWVLKKYIKKKKLEKNILILPYHDDLSKLREQACYAITSSKNEALGRVTIEAMLAGNIVIGARSGGTSEIIGKDKERGFLYELGNVNSLADIMEEVINLPNEIKNIVRINAQQYVESIFDSKRYCKELIEIYNTAIDSFKERDNSKFLNTLEEHCYSIKNIKKTIEKNESASYVKSIMALKLVLKWLKIKQNGCSLDKYFKDRNIQTVALYGVGELGRCFYEELENSDIIIEYFIDREPHGMEKVFKFVRLDSEKIDVDAIIVSVISEEKKIVNEIRTHGYEMVIGLSDIINSFDSF